MIDVADEVQELDEIKLAYPKIPGSTFISGTNAEDIIKKAFGYTTHGETICKTNQPSQVLMLPKPNDSLNKSLGEAATERTSNAKAEKCQASKSIIGKYQTTKPKAAKAKKNQQQKMVIKMNQ